jgi:DNA-binding transcriptional LysR family regulator
MYFLYIIKEGNIMDNRQLSYFLAIVEEESISKASKKLFIAQPYLSQQLKLLEDELGINLIERTTRKFHVTEAGKMLSYRARQILELSEATVKELQDLNAGLKGTLFIGCVSSASETILTQKIYDFHKRYERIDFEVRQGGTSEILELLKSGNIEIGIIRNPANLDIYESISLPNEPMVAVTNSRVDFKGDKYDMTLKELADKPLLVHRKFENDIVESFRRQGLEPRILCKTENTKSLLLLAEQGIGIAIVPRDWLGLIPESRLEYYEIGELHMETGIVIAWAKNHYLTSAARHFLDCFRTE